MNKRLMFTRLMEEQNGEGGVGNGAPPAGGTPPPAAWYDSFENNDVKEWLKSYGEAYPNPEAVATKALNLEKFVGAEKSGRGVVAPKPDAPAEEWQAFYKKVGGVPEKPDDYKLPSTIKPEIATALADDPMVKSFKEYAHNKGIPPMFFQDVMSWYIGQMAGKDESMMNDFNAKSEQDLADLKSEWKGIEYDKNIEMGRRAATQFIPHSNADELATKIASIEGALGTKETLKLWASIGAAIGEHGFESGQGNGGNGGMTAEAARVRIAALKKDSAFATKMASGDTDAKAEWDRLHKIGYGG